jgi:hypothetical protein
MRAHFKSKTADIHLMLTQSLPVATSAGARRAPPVPHVPLIPSFPVRVRDTARTTILLRKHPQWVDRDM